jgi:hypothetical protein
VERVKRMGGVLSSRPASVPRASADNRIKQTVDRAMSPSTASRNSGLFLVSDS